MNDDRLSVEITSRRGDAVLISKADQDALEETAHLLRGPANARWLVESLLQARAVEARIRGFLVTKDQRRASARVPR